MGKRTKKEMNAALFAVLRLAEKASNKGLMFNLYICHDSFGMWFTGYVKTVAAGFERDCADCHYYNIYNFLEPEDIEKNIKAIEDFIVKH